MQSGGVRGKRKIFFPILITVLFLTALPEGAPAFDRGSPDVATFSIVSMVNWLWSVARFTVEKTGASSN